VILTQNLSLNENNFRKTFTFAQKKSSFHHEKKSNLFFFLLISIAFDGQEKSTFTEDFKELPSAENAVYYST
jgi:hypothetical protein